MSNFFFGKISQKHFPEQLTEGFYIAEKNSTWFGELNVNDYVFIIGDGKVQFWRAKEYEIDRMKFEILCKDCNITPGEFSSLNFFKLNMELIIKSMRSTASEKKAFFNLELIDSNSNIVKIFEEAENYPKNLRKIILYENKEACDKLSEKNNNNIELFYNNNELEIIYKDFIDETLLKNFNGKFPSNNGPKKQKTIDKFNLEDKKFKELDILMQDLYDVLFTSAQKVDNDSDIPIIKNMGNNTNIPLNQILYGPPGTGKTYNTVNYAIDILDHNSPNLKWEEKKKRFDELRNEGRIVFTTFHQSMCYEDFVEGIKPKIENGNVVYNVVDGIFKTLCNEAKIGNINNTEPQNYLLIIDEINRGNVSQIFGELITLLEEDKRLKNEFELKVKLPYSKEDFGIPSNLYIIGTMNTADRSVEALDTALRRRFSFVEMMPDTSLIEDKKIGNITLKEVLDCLNKRILILKDREHQIGHSYFMKCSNGDDLKNIFKNNIIPLLQEYFYGNYENIYCILGNGFIKVDPNNIVFASQPSYYDNNTHYRLLTNTEWEDLDIEKAIATMLNKPKSSEELYQ